MIALLSRDLMAISSVSGAASSFGQTLQTAGAVDQLQAKITGDVSLIAIDLAGLQEDIGTVVPKIRAAWPQATIVAFGPHVATRELEAASAAGCDRVMARGQFLGQLSLLLRGAGNELR